MLIASRPVLPLGGPELLRFLLEVGLLLMSALLFGRLAMRFKLPAITGELLAGVLFGPSVLGAFAPGLAARLLPPQAPQMHLLEAIGQVGVLLLVAITAIELDLRLVRRRGGTAVSVSVPGLLVPFGLGISVGILAPESAIPDTTNRTVFASFLGIAMCVSAIPVIAKTLIDLRLLHRNIGQLAVVAGTVDDLIGWLGLSVVSAMATSRLDAGVLAWSWLKTAAFLLIGLTVGRALVRASVGLAARSPEPGPTVAVVVVLVLLGAAAAQALGLEPVVGALLVGLLVGSDPTLNRARLAPLYAVVLSVLAPVFFATVGLRMDLTALTRPTVLATAMVLLVAAITGKFGGAYIGARMSRLNSWEALAMGAAMNARGIIEIIVAMVGLRLAVLSTDMYTVIVLIAIVTSLMAAPILKFAMARVDVTAAERLRAQNSLGLYGVIDPADATAAAPPPAGPPSAGEDERGNPE